MVIMPLLLLERRHAGSVILRQARRWRYGDEHGVDDARGMSAAFMDGLREAPRYAAAPCSLCADAANADTPNAMPCHDAAR